ncbi:MAG: DUF1127 domain-containing protein [Rhodospirillales bacterium]|nr:DUF1127 domain-containing protein [Rhodospirillales bacterium]
MATAYLQNREIPIRKTILNELVFVKNKLSTVWRRHRRYQQIVSELGFSTDRQLADMGISRSDIRCLARQAADQVEHS